MTASLSPRRILVIFNPAAGRNRRAKLEKVLAVLRRYTKSVIVQETCAPGHAVTLARDATDIDVIAAAGGDGTINEIVNGLRGKSLALGVIPLGTANVLADEIGLGRDADAIARALAYGPLRPIHVGEANGRRFVMMAGAGFDAEVVNGVSLGLKKKLGPLAYVWQTAKQAFAEGSQGCEVTIDGAQYRAESAVVCNGRHYGGPFVAVPQASLEDRVLHVILLKGRGWTSVLRYGLALVLGRLTRLPDVQIVPGDVIAVRGFSPRPVQADGDIITTLPARIRLDPECVLLTFPA